MYWLNFVFWTNLKTCVNKFLLHNMLLKPYENSSNMPHNNQQDWVFFKYVVDKYSNISKQVATEPDITLPVYYWTTCYLNHMRIHLICNIIINKIESSSNMLWTNTITSVNKLPLSQILLYQLIWLYVPIREIAVNNSSMISIPKNKYYSSSNLH